MRSVDLAIYADTLAAESASVAARIERARSRLRQVAIERRAREELTSGAVTRLESFGLLATRADRAELRELEEVLDALRELESWVERQLSAAA